MIHNEIYKDYTLSVHPGECSGLFLLFIDEQFSDLKFLNPEAAVLQGRNIIDEIVQ